MLPKPDSYHRPDICNAALAAMFSVPSEPKLSADRCCRSCPARLLSLLGSASTTNQARRLNSSATASRREATDGDAIFWFSPTSYPDAKGVYPATLQPSCSQDLISLGIMLSPPSHCFSTSTWTHTYVEVDEPATCLASERSDWSMTDAPDSRMRKGHQVLGVQHQQPSIGIQHGLESSCCLATCPSSPTPITRNTTPRSNGGACLAC
ncbi:hypothetical protein BT67DRAFT_283581 [Trichocladium antarcticum]|uniref:Uncharacterized protein n=1 Tax=Trichocladium antarcticum TaxID=1450529 RepID=A0AAN6ZET7_9PEZI|nr:hypothetical protein BT67DRAFT_283581 [Trichocladium antarcticum]